MLTVWSPTEPEICAFFVENTFDEGIRFHPRPNELVQLTPWVAVRPSVLRIARRMLSMSVDFPLPLEPITAL